MAWRPRWAPRGWPGPELILAVMGFPGYRPQRPADLNVAGLTRFTSAAHHL